MRHNGTSIFPCVSVVGLDALLVVCTTPKQEQPDKRGIMSAQAESPSFPFQVNNSIVAYKRKQLQDSRAMDAMDPWRRGRGYLSDDIERVCREYNGAAPLTPYRAAGYLVEVDSLEEEDRPSHGAVRQIFQRWEREGRAYFMKNPYAFIAFKEPLSSG